MYLSSFNVFLVFICSNKLTVIASRIAIRIVKDRWVALVWNKFALFISILIIFIVIYYISSLVLCGRVSDICNLWFFSRGAVFNLYIVIVNHFLLRLLNFAYVIERPLIVRISFQYLYAIISLVERDGLQYSAFQYPHLNLVYKIEILRIDYTI